MNPSTDAKLKIEPHPDVLREELRQVREKLSSLMREASRETDMGRAQALQVEIAAYNRSCAALMTKLGISSLTTKADNLKQARQKFLPTQDLTVDELLTLAAAGKTTPEGAAALADLRTIPGQKTLIMPWVPPPFAPSPDAQSVAAFMNGAKTFSPLQGVMRSPKDPHFKKGGGLKNLATVTQPPQYVGQDGEWIALLQQVPAEYARHRPQIEEALAEAVSGYYVAAGPVEGWFARILKGDSRPHPEFTLTEAEQELVFRLLPYDEKLAPDFKNATLADLLKTVRINGSAGAGMPRHHKKAVCMKEILSDAAEYYSLLVNKKFGELQSRVPGEFLTIAKMKLDRYAAADWGKKVRPYYNMNGGLALLYSCVVQAYAGCLKGFWEDPNSCNAHGFAWNSGGGDRLYAWIEWASAQGPGVRAIGYSDDGLWVINTPDGKTLVSDKDVEQMDSSMGDSFMLPYKLHLFRVLEKVLTDGWAQIARASTAAVFRQIVLLYKSLVYKSKHKVHSGVPGTAEADQVGFAILYALLRLLDPKTVEEFEAAAEKIYQRIGLKFKPSSWHEFKPGQDEYPFEFLGKRLVKFRGHYIPAVTLQKAVIQLVTPKSNRGGLDGQRAWMERARGLAVTSLYWHKPLYEIAKAAYNRKLESRITPAATMDGAENGENDLDQILGQGLTVRFPDDKFPQLGWIYSLYLGSLVQEEPQTKVPVLVPQQTAAEAFADFYGEEEPTTSSHWADRGGPTLQQEQASQHLVEGQRIRDLPVKPAATFAEQVNPLPDYVARELKAARKAAFNAMMKDQPARKGQYLKGGAVSKLLRPDEDTEIVFTKGGIERQWTQAVQLDSLVSGIADDDEWEQYYPEDMEDDDEIDQRLEAEELARYEAAYERSQRRRR
jgi:hypothetical protein